MPRRSAPPDEPLHVTVVTVAHRGDDARIAFRQIGALRRAGASVRFIAPGPVATGSNEDPVPVERIVIDRATEWKRFRSWWQAHRVVRGCRGATDIVIVHDLEAVIPVRLARPGCPVVWDVHEDMVASVDDRDWIPRWMRPPMKRLVAAVERLAVSGSRMLLAEESYRQRLGDWPVVPNSTAVPAHLPRFEQPSRPYVIYVGRLSAARGLRPMIQLGRDLRGEAQVVLVGAVDDDMRDVLRNAVSSGAVVWKGPLPNPDALTLMSGASVGLCLLEPLQNYVVSMPTKVYEYFAHGVPAVVSPLPLAVEAVERSNAGSVVDPHDREAIAAAVRAFTTDPERRRRAGRNGYEWVRKHHDWHLDGQRFVSTLTDWAATGATEPGVRRRSANLFRGR